MRLQPCGRGRRVRPRPRAVISAAALVALAPAALPAQQSTSMNAYTLGWDNAASHLYDVSLTFPSEGRDSVDVHREPPGVPHVERLADDLLGRERERVVAAHRPGRDGRGDVLGW